MGNCLVTKLKEVVNRDLPYFNKIAFDMEVLEAGNNIASINYSDYSIAKYSNNATGKAIIVGGNAVFDNGTKEALLSSKPFISSDTVGDKFKLILEDKDKILKMYIPSDNNKMKLTLDSFMDLSNMKNLQKINFNTKCYGELGNISLPSSMLVFYNLTTNGVTGKITSINNSCQTLQCGKAILSKNAVVNKDLHNLSSFSLHETDDTITIKEIADALTYGNNPNLLASWGSLFSNSVAGSVLGDIGDVPSNVYYMNTSYSYDAMTCTLGKRNTPDCEVICCGGAIFSLYSEADVNNFLINNAGCTFTSSIRKNDTEKSMNMRIKGDLAYTPSAEALSAIATLKSKGVLSIKVGGVSF